MSHFHALVCYASRDCLSPLVRKVRPPFTPRLVCLTLVWDAFAPPRPHPLSPTLVWYALRLCVHQAVGGDGKALVPCPPVVVAAPDATEGGLEYGGDCKAVPLPVEAPSHVAAEYGMGGEVENARSRRDGERHAEEGAREQARTAPTVCSMALSRGAGARGPARREDGAVHRGGGVRGDEVGLPRDCRHPLDLHR